MYPAHDSKFLKASIKLVTKLILGTDAVLTSKFSQNSRRLTPSDIVGSSFEYRMPNGVIRTGSWQEIQCLIFYLNLHT